MGVKTGHITIYIGIEFDFFLCVSIARWILNLGTGGFRKEKQKTVASALFFMFGEEQLFLFSVIRSNQNCI